MKIFLISFLTFLLFSCHRNTQEVHIENLKCEYLVNPIGLDCENPRFTWQMKTERPGASQQAYQVIVGTDSADILNGEGISWKSERINSGLIPYIYNGPELKPFTRYYWAVRIRDDKRTWSEFSQIAFFETGMMNEKNWTGSWITDSRDQNIKEAPYFRKSFNIEKNVISARAYIAVAGLYELYINGEKIGDHRLDPMVTRFDKRTLYVSYDVTKNLQEGENVIGVLLGNGWYNHQSTAVWFFHEAPWRGRPKFCLDMRLTYDDGEKQLVSSGLDWKTALSPVIFNSIYTGEHYDARLEQPGWNNTGFDDSEWATSSWSDGIRFLLNQAPSHNITAQALHPIRNVEDIPAKEMVQLNSNTYIFDFGRNFAGVTRIAVSGEKGTTIRLKHAEIVNEQGYADVSNIDEHYRPTDDSDPFQTDIFILKGQGEETFMPRFNYKGFQYVEVTADKPLRLTKESLTAYVMHSDVPPAGSIRSSNPLIDKIWQATNATYLSNLFGYPTDCPTREKLGWLGDGSRNVETGLYNFDAITIYEKWMADHQDEQQPNGTLPVIIPSSGWGYRAFNGPDWLNSIAFVPWDIYLFYGDSRSLESVYGNIKRYLDYMDRVAPEGLTSIGARDWNTVKSITPTEFLASTTLYVIADIFSKAAKLFERQDDYEKYSAMSEKIKDAINTKYFNKETGIYGEGNQTQLSMALKWGLVPEGFSSKVAENLAKRVIADGSHVDVGFTGSKAILNALSENGYADLAYTVASQETFPSWGWWIVNGGTTLQENWEIEAQARNHPGFGEISAWFYKALGGIFPDESQPGFKNVLLKPNFVTGLEHFEASHEGPYGTIISSWARSGGKVSYNVTIPASSTATLYLTDVKEVLENNRDLRENRYVRVEKTEGSDLKIFLQSGSYEFLIH